MKHSSPYRFNIGDFVFLRESTDTYEPGYITDIKLKPHAAGKYVYRVELYQDYSFSWGEEAVIIPFDRYWCIHYHRIMAKFNPATGAGLVRSTGEFIKICCEAKLDVFFRKIENGLSLFLRTQTEKKITNVSFHSLKYRISIVAKDSLNYVNQLNGYLREFKLDCYQVDLTGRYIQAKIDDEVCEILVGNRYLHSANELEVPVMDNKSILTIDWVLEQNSDVELKTNDKARYVHFELLNRKTTERIGLIAFGNLRHLIWLYITQKTIPPILHASCIL